MVNKGNIRYYGELFKGKSVTPAIREALEEAREYGTLAIRARTPVRTGKLKAGWSSHLEGNGIRWKNDAPYSIYVEMGTRHMAPRQMLAKSIPEIEQVFNRALARSLGKRLATRITAPSGSTPSYEQYRGQTQVQQPKAATSLLDRLRQGLRGSN